jgi:hypothetical protein
MGGIVAMSSTINASTASGGGVITTADASGILQLQTAGVTGLTIDASQNVTLAKGLTVGASAAPAFSAYQSSAQTISSSTKIQFQTEDFDTANCFDSATNYRFTPNVAGYYQVIGSVQGGSSNAYIQPFIYKNGSSVKSGSFVGVASAFHTAQISYLVYMNGSTDYVELWASQSVSQSLTLGAANGTYFQAFLARSA